MLYTTAIIANMIKQFTDNLYTYPGGTIAPLYCEAKKLGLNIVVARQEQGAGYMALAEAALHNRPSFVAVTSGPGATNIITPIADAFYDSVPLVVICGQVSTNDLNRSQTIRQRGFQEVPITKLVEHITKKTFQPKTFKDLVSMLQVAVEIANTGRKGPVVIDLPMDVQLQQIQDDDLDKFNPRVSFPQSDKSISSGIDFNFIARTINNSQKPLILVGGGAQEDWAQIRRLLEKTHIPAISSLRGIGILNNSLDYGWIGHTGTPYANTLLYEADTVIVLGSRLDVRQTGTKTDIFKTKNIIHVDIDEEELKYCRIDNNIKINIPIKTFLDTIQDLIHLQNIDKWIQYAQELKLRLKLDDIAKEKSNKPTPKQILSFINEMLQDKKYYIATGVGLHQHWVARYVDFDNAKSRFFTSAGHGTMGYGLPSALGLSYIEKDNTLTICIDGDGSFQMNLQELALVKTMNLKIKILIIDNNRLGLVSQFQNITFDDDPTTGHIINPDFVKIAQSYGIKAYSINTFDKGIIEDWITSEEASLLHVKIEHDTPLSPMLLGGQELNQMWYENEQ
ncbi:MAG: thiamine pyrophosphate-binding protein [Sulfurospirillaceae bacterium]|nr:thiamine pyrophosphate-binding protein [Sulfurospirillaceae bacterium]